MTREEFIREIGKVQESLRRFLYTLCGGDTFMADDIAQEACVKAWLSLDGFHERSRLSTWVFRIAWNIWYDTCSCPRSTSLDSDEVRRMADGGQSDDLYKYERLHLAISELTPNEKAAILLFYMEDKSIKDIAAIMKMPSGTVKSLLSRGRSKLKIELKEP